MTTATDPLVIRIHGRPEQPRAYVADVLGPLATGLRRDHRLRAVHLRRGWRGGPHYEVVVRPENGRPLDVSGWSARAGAALAGTPLDGPTEADYLSQARRMERWEQTGRSAPPLRAPGTVLIASDTAGADWLPELREARTAVQAALLDPLLAALREHRDEDALLAHLAEVMATLAGTHPGRLPFGTMSFRSHAEAFLASPLAGQDHRPDFRRRFERDADHLTALVRRHLADGPGPETAGWHAAFRYGWGYLDALVRSGRLGNAYLDGFAPAAPDGSTRPPTRFHALTEQYGITTDPDDSFASYRSLLNFFYELLPLLDVTPLHRYYLCFALAEATDLALGETWEERIRRAAPARSTAAPTTATTTTE
ncbi:hypothetical protein ACFVHB_18225 [Kitasatospora sp. NPDC127111]|uniref:hypothetical protein n=1 Tax=Kitasatospora sp. NPDC127111 TaxID=3345363 RepID=UPI00362A99BC